MPKHESLAAALAAFQAELPKLRKDEKAKVTGESKSGAKISYTYGYAGLDAVVEAVLPALGNHGLSITSKSTLVDGGFMLEVSLLHESGERETGYWPLPDPRRVGPQDIGSSYTYGRRYLTLALTGTFPGGEDDDGAKAQQASRDSWEEARPRQRPVEDRQAQSGEEPQAAPAPAAPAKTSWDDNEVRDYQQKIATSELDMAVKGYDWMASKNLHNRAVGDALTEPSLTATQVMATRLGEEALAGDTTPAAIEGLKAIAAARGLLKIQVSATETLDQVLFEAKELADHAAAQAGTGEALAEEQGD
jgi:ERF superfamily protein